MMSFQTRSQTPAAGLSYNLRVGTTPGGSEIFSPMAGADGLRRVVRAGNAGMTNAWIARLQPGAYYWSVQAIDAGFTGSPFALEQSFTLGPWTITRFTPLGAGRLQMRFSTVGTNQPSAVVVSGNLVDWAVLTPVVVSTPGQAEFTDLEAPSTSSRFYKLK
jgi:hypothetical protein